MSAYTDDSPFSIDLVGAVSAPFTCPTAAADEAWKVVRQSSFVKKMHDLGWCEPTFFESELDIVTLQHAVARYHG
jgi:hypothetical protein